MSATKQVYEGTWEEIARKAGDFIGHKVRVEILEPDTSTPADRVSHSEAAPRNLAELLGDYIGAVKESDKSAFRANGGAVCRLRGAEAPRGAPVTLCDTGPLVALILESDPNHERCRRTAETLPPEPLVTTWVWWAEAMYLVGRAGGFSAQQRLWNLRRAGTIRFHFPLEGEEERMERLMEQYQDSPMDLADASLIAAAEGLGLRRVFTLDEHFLFYRINNSDSFEVVP